MSETMIINDWYASKYAEYIAKFADSAEGANEKIARSVELVEDAIEDMTADEIVCTFSDTYVDNGIRGFEYEADFSDTLDRYGLTEDDINRYVSCKGIREVEIFAISAGGERI